MKNFTASDGIRLNYVIDDFTDPRKPKDTLILLHAVLGSSRRFYQWIPVLSRHIRVVRLDMRGHGESEVPDENHFSLVVPDSDPHIALAQYEVIKAHVPHCGFVVYRGYQHNITDAVPQRCAEELLRFLRGNGAAK